MPAWLWLVLLCAINPFTYILTSSVISAVRETFAESRERQIRTQPTWVQRPSPVAEHWFTDEIEERGVAAEEATPERYGELHQSERAKYAEIIRQFGGVCMERECIMPSRRIDPGSYWELAHDHERGGAGDYLGPAHQQCNQAEALSRGVTWDGAPTLDELLQSVGRTRGGGGRVRPEDPWATRPASVEVPWGDPS